MRALLWVAIWTALSFPLGVLIGKFLRGRGYGR